MSHPLTYSYTLWGWKRFLLPVTYFPTNLVYPFTLGVTGINTQAHYLLLHDRLVEYNPLNGLVQQVD